MKTVYFDLGNVLFFFSHPKMIDQVARCAALPVDGVKKLMIDHQLQIAYESGKLNTQDLYRLFKAQSSKQFSLYEFADALSNIFTPNEPLWPLVERLKKEGIRLILLSNTCESHYNYLYSHYPILRLFDQKILSFEVGSMKPEPTIFHRALSHSECPHSECFYTDDIPSFVLGARKAGLDAEVYTDVATLQDHLIRRGCSFLKKNG